MKLLYEYNNDGTYKCDKLVNSLKDVLITSTEEKQLIDGEETIVKVPLEIPVLPKGLTDVKPAGTVIPNISPKFINGEWVEDKEALDAHLTKLPNLKSRLTYEQLDDAVTFILNNMITSSK